jgi:hypothetical protein
VYSARALALIHAAMADAYSNAHRAGGGAAPFEPAFVSAIPPGKALPAAALGGAAHTVLSAIHTWQRPIFDRRKTEFLLTLKGADPQAVTEGWAFGQAVGQTLLNQREKDGSEDPTNGNLASGYVPGGLNGMHAPDPLNPGQGFYGRHFGRVEPMGMTRAELLQTMPPPPPQTHTKEYLDDYAEVLVDGARQAKRTPEQTDIGVFWAYDGVPGLGTPPRLYNQVLREVCRVEGLDGDDTRMAALLGQFHVAMMNAGIVAWHAKYLYNVWRPIVGIRGHVEVPGLPGGPADAGWTPLGAPASNGGKDFTPPFPAYPSGHASFGAAGFTVLKLFLQREGVSATGDRIDIDFTSDELNGVTFESDGVTRRPNRPQPFTSIDDMIQKNLESRVWLGVHWRFDGVHGVTSGAKVGCRVAESMYLLREPAMA